MAPLVPRMHVFEIDDQPWFPPWFRRRVQAALTRAWTTRVPVLQRASPAQLVAEVLQQQVLTESQSTTRAAAARRPWTMIDFCAGGGGPTPSIERTINGKAEDSPAPIQFVLTDLHPHVDEWAIAAASSPNVHYAPDSVDASAAEPAAILQAAGLAVDASKEEEPPRVFRLFSLAFHHFDDPLARAILRNTIETSDGFGIFELQDRSFPAFVTTLAFGIGILLMAPYYAWRWRSPMTLIFTYLVPILPFVLIFDGWMSMLRTRTPDETDVLLQTCGAAPADLVRWKLHSGETCHLWPFGYVKWIVCVKQPAETSGNGAAVADSATEVDVDASKHKAE